MTLTPVSSAAISEIGYDGYTLVVVFHKSGRYDHPGVPYQVYIRLMHASSKGAFYNEYIRGRYR